MIDISVSVAENARLVFCKALFRTKVEILFKFDVIMCVSWKMIFIFIWT